jgi:hypothetical protein
LLGNVMHIIRQIARVLPHLEISPRRPGPN